MVDGGALCRVQPHLCLVLASQAGCWGTVGNTCVSAWGSALLSVPQQPRESFWAPGLLNTQPVSGCPGGFGHGQDRAWCWCLCFPCRTWEPGTHGPAGVGLGACV